jgi:hypothetical protein
VQNNYIFLDSIVNLKKKFSAPHFSPKKMTATATKIDSSRESGKNFMDMACFDYNPL